MQMRSASLPVSNIGTGRACKSIGAQIHSNYWLNSIRMEKLSFSKNKAILGFVEVVLAAGLAPPTAQSAGFLHLFRSNWRRTYSTTAAGLLGTSGSSLSWRAGTVLRKVAGNFRMGADSTPDFRTNLTRYDSRDYRGSRWIHFDSDRAIRSESDGHKCWLFWLV